MSSAVQIVLVVAAVAYVLARRVRGEPAQGRRLLILPAVLTLIGLTGIAGILESPVSVMFLVVGVVVGIVLAALRAASVDISERGGVAFVRYTRTTVVLWIVSAVIEIGESVAHGLLEPGHAGSEGSGLMISLGLGLLVEGLVVLHRATRAGHPLAWDRTRGTRSTSWIERLPAGTAPVPAARRDRRDRRRRHVSRR